MFHFTRESNDEGKGFLPRDATRTMISNEVSQSTALKCSFGCISGS